MIDMRNITGVQRQGPERIHHVLLTASVLLPACPASLKMASIFLVSKSILLKPESNSFPSNLKLQAAVFSSLSRRAMPVDRGAWWAMVLRVTKSQTRLKRLSTHALCSYKAFLLKVYSLFLKRDPDWKRSKALSVCR